MKNIIIVVAIIAAFYWFKNRNKTQETSPVKDLDYSSNSSWLLPSSSLNTPPPVVTTATPTSSSTNIISSNSVPSVSYGTGSGSATTTIGGRLIKATQVLPTFSFGNPSKSCFR